MQAVVFAEIFASASLCGCDTERHVQDEAIANVWADATSRAYAEACVRATFITCTRLS